MSKAKLTAVGWLVFILAMVKISTACFGPDRGRWQYAADLTQGVALACISSLLRFPS